MFQNKIHPISHPRSNIALQVQNHGLKHHSFQYIHKNSSTSYPGNPTLCCPETSPSHLISSLHVVTAESTADLSYDAFHVTVPKCTVWPVLCPVWHCVLLYILVMVLGGSHSTVVVCWTAGNKVKQSILHQGDS